MKLYDFNLNINKLKYTTYCKERKKEATLSGVTFDADTDEEAIKEKLNLYYPTITRYILSYRYYKKLVISDDEFHNLTKKL
jgi:hypothetical protein